MRWGHHGADLFVQHILQILDWNETQRIWRSTPKTLCCAPQMIYEQFLFCGRAHYPAKNTPLSSGNTVSMKGCEWSATILG